MLRDKYLQSRLPSEWTASSSAEHHFSGKVGLELGGPSGIFARGAALPVYDWAERVDNYNFAGDTAWVRAQRPGRTFVFDPRKPAGYQFLGEASALDTVSDSSYDFVLSSHCIEHLANPVLALTEWRRVLKASGALLLVVPHKDGTFDHRRPVTTLSHLIEDYERHTSEADDTHLPEVLRLHDLSRDAGSSNLAEFERRCKENLDHRCVHHHVFDTHLTVELVDWVDFQIVHVQLLRPFHIVVLARKLEARTTKNNTPFLGRHAPPVWSSPLPADQRNYR